MLLAGFMGVCISLITLFRLPDIITILIQVALGIVVYIYSARFFGIDSFEYVFELINSMMIKIKKK